MFSFDVISYNVESWASEIASSFAKIISSRNQRGILLFCWKCVPVFCFLIEENAWSSAKIMDTIMLWYSTLPWYLVTSYVNSSSVSSVIKFHDFSNHWPRIALVNIFVLLIFCFVNIISKWKKSDDTKILYFDRENTSESVYYIIQTKSISWRIDYREIISF